MSCLKFESVKKSYGGIEIIKDLNLSIADGERLILLGPSGCGKSTTLRMIAGLEQISSGHLYFDHRIVNDVPAGERNISMVFQNYALYPHMTVEDNITYSLKVHRVANDEIKRRLQEAIEVLNLQGYEKRKPKDLSGGQRQRVALARAIVKRGDIFLLDEPLSNLDAQLRAHARKELLKIHQQYKQTFIYVTHDQIEAMTLGDKIALLYDGELQMFDTPENIFNRPANVFTASFIGSPACNLIDVVYHEGNFRVGAQRIEMGLDWRQHLQKTQSDQLILGVRPEQVMLSLNQVANSLCGRVLYSENLGNKMAVYCDIEGHEWVCVTDCHRVNAGEKAYLSFAEKVMHVFHKLTERNIGYPDAMACRVAV